MARPISRLSSAAITCRLACSAETQRGSGSNAISRSLRRRPRVLPLSPLCRDASASRARSCRSETRSRRSRSVLGGFAHRQIPRRTPPLPPWRCGRGRTSATVNAPSAAYIDHTASALCLADGLRQPGVRAHWRRTTAPTLEAVRATPNQLPLVTVRPAVASLRVQCIGGSTCILPGVIVTTRRCFGSDSPWSTNGP